MLTYSGQRKRTTINLGMWRIRVIVFPGEEYHPLGWLSNTNWLSQKCTSNIKEMEQVLFIIFINTF